MTYVTILGDIADNTFPVYVMNINIHPQNKRTSHHVQVHTARRVTITNIRVTAVTYINVRLKSDVCTCPCITLTKFLRCLLLFIVVYINYPGTLT